MNTWEIWIIIGLVLIIAEIFTSGFAIACFSVGCFFGAIAAALNLSLSWQLLLFAVASFLAFIFIRPFVLKIIDKRGNKHQIATNMDGLIGRTAEVTETIQEDDLGRIKIDGDDWKARSIDGHRIEKGTKVEILSYDSIIITVKTHNQ